MEIFIHVGPPKTGTSFVQQWCSRHREWLILKGIYYPEHHLDKNLISSGNLLSLFDFDSSNNLTFSNKKLEIAKEKAKELNSNSILFSSEYFFDHVEELLDKIPEARIVLYLRNELEVVESSHNQSVKRHFKSSHFEDINQPISTNLRKILRYFQSYKSDKFLLRFYAKELFVGGNIVSDLLHTVGLSATYFYIQNKTVNSSYSHKALEFKRALNFFTDRKFHDALDEYLQQISEDSSRYSLLSKKGYNHAKTGYLEQIKEFLDAFPQDGAKAFIEVCENSVQTRRVPQFIHASDVKKIVKGWIHFHPSSYYKLKELCRVAKKRNLEHYQKHVIQTIESAIQNERHMSFTNIIYKAFQIGKSRRSPEIESVNLEQPTKKQKSKIGSVSSSHERIKLISHHIPKTAGSSFGKALTQAYGRESIYGVYKDTGANLLTNGQGIGLPKNVCVLHGHFTSHLNHKTMFPNAKRICWVRDPAERLWSLTKHILRNKQPIAHYQSLLKYANNNDELSVVKAFSLVLEKPEFEAVRNDYQRYFQHISPENFDFVGSVHRYEDGLSELENLINLPLESLRENTAPDSESLVMKHPEIYLKAKSLLKPEFCLVQRFC